MADEVLIISSGDRATAVDVDVCRATAVSSESRARASSVILDGHFPDYEETYTAVPDLAGFELQTAHKSLKNNITVEPVPVQIVSNESGGRTYTIA